jgi:hypothetical protein
MGSAGLQPQPDSEPDAAGQFLTFVVPAPDSCKLKCVFCLVRQRRAITKTRLRPDDLARLAERSPIFALAIQAYERLSGNCAVALFKEPANIRLAGPLPRTFVLPA